MLITVVGLILIISLSKKLSQYNRFSTLLVFVGANTLFYFAFHGKVYSLLFAMLNKFSPQVMEINEVILSIFIVILDALILIIPTMMINKYTPYILGKNYKLWKTDNGK